MENIFNLTDVKKNENNINEIIDGLLETLNENNMKQFEIEKIFDFSDMISSDNINNNDLIENTYIYKNGEDIYIINDKNIIKQQE